MRIITFNVNGIRSAISKGFIEWIKEESFDVICLQEVKANREDVNLEELESLGYHVYWYSAQKKGYSGVAILSKEPAIHIQYGHDNAQSDSEGRVIQAEFEKFFVISAYFPSGTSGEIRQSYKYIWLDEFQKHITQLNHESNKPIFICGDYNIAHADIDIHSPKTNQKSSGFLPEERDWMSQFLKSDWVDIFRNKNPEIQKYSWWSFRANARANNKGWRIDYITVNAGYESIVESAHLLNDIVMSDHCPMLIELKEMS